jgi:hypothetical protein
MTTAHAGPVPGPLTAGAGPVTVGQGYGSGRRGVFPGRRGPSTQEATRALESASVLTATSRWLALVAGSAVVTAAPLSRPVLAAQLNAAKEVVTAGTHRGPAGEGHHRRGPETYLFVSHIGVNHDRVRHPRLR